MVYNEVMRLKNDFIIRNVDGETVMVPVAGDFHGVVMANETTAFILDCLKDDCEIEDIIEKMMAAYEVSYEVVKEDIEAVIAKLESIGALE